MSEPQDLIRNTSYHSVDIEVSFLDANFNKYRNKIMLDSCTPCNKI